METDIVYNVELVVQADLIVYGGSGGGTGTASAYLDPTFAIGPGVINPGQYSFVFSTGVGNTPAVAIPEPSTWAILGIGFAGMAGLDWRLRARQQS
jgi:hypothetical protein